MVMTYQTAKEMTPVLEVSGITVSHISITRKCNKYIEKEHDPKSTRIFLSINLGRTTDIAVTNIEKRRMATKKFEKLI